MNYEYSYQYDPSMSAGADGTVAAAVFFGIFAVALIISLAFYIYVAVCLMKIAKRTGTPNGWFAWIPILNVILMLQIANKPIWWLLLFFIPGVNIIFTILVWMEIAKAVGKPEWWGILMIVPFVNLVVPGYLAFFGEASQMEVQTQDPLQSTEPNVQANQEKVVSSESEIIKEDVSASSDTSSADEEAE